MEKEDYINIINEEYDILKKNSIIENGKYPVIIKLKNTKDSFINFTLEEKVFKLLEKIKYSFNLKHILD